MLGPMGIEVALYLVWCVLRVGVSMLETDEMLPMGTEVALYLVWCVLRVGASTLETDEML